MRKGLERRWLLFVSALSRQHLMMRAEKARLGRGREKLTRGEKLRLLRLAVREYLGG